MWRSSSGQELRPPARDPCDTVKASNDTHSPGVLDILASAGLPVQPPGDTSHPNPAYTTHSRRATQVTYRFGGGLLHSHS